MKELSNKHSSALECLKAPPQLRPLLVPALVNICQGNKLWQLVEKTGPLQQNGAMEQGRACVDSRFKYTPGHIRGAV